MKHLFVPYELAVKAKELKFSDDCLANYHVTDNGPSLFIMYTTDHVSFGHVVAAPLYQQLVDWFREEYKIYVSVLLIGNSISQSWEGFVIKNLNPNMRTEIQGRKDYHEAITSALTEAFKLI